jgi:2,3-bisphosphoglycerate-dependent phosphoglycerate mutase
VYFVRHAESDHEIIDELTRPLTKNGILEAKKLVGIFNKIRVDAIFCSPYMRSIATVKPLADEKKATIIIRENLKERLSGTPWIDNQMDLETFIGKMFSNINESPDGGESIKDLRERNIQELEKILKENKDKTIIIGTHGTALASIIGNYDKSFSGNNFMKFINIMPYIVRMEFEGNKQIKADLGIPYTILT